MELREAFASELVGQPVRLHAGTQHVGIGRVEDVAVAGSETFPSVTGLYIKGNDGIRRYAPFASIELLGPKEITLGSPPLDATQAPAVNDELLLNKELLDRS